MSNVREGELGRVIEDYKLQSWVGFYKEVLCMSNYLMSMSDPKEVVA